MMFFNIVAGKFDRPMRMEAGKYVKIRQLKETIKANFGIEVARQTLKFNNQVLEDNKTFGDYNLEEVAVPPSRIEVDIQPLPPNTHISVQLIESETDKCYDVNVREDNLVKDLKGIVGGIWNVDPDRVRLWCMLEEMDDDAARLSEYLVHNNIKIKVAINPTPEHSE